MNIKELLDNKREYYESERELGEEINQFIRKTIMNINPQIDAKAYFIKIEFNEMGKYSHDELEITSVSDYLTDDVIGALVNEYGLVVTYKCVQTGFNMNTKEVNMQSKVFFMCNQIDVLETDEEVVEDEVIEEDVGEDEEE
ncbi:MAG: hypothetical protein IKG40_01370 [Bacilli bacterium]|nr:hypothetical protein [Bacilli bacterium]